MKRKFKILLILLLICLISNVAFSNYRSSILGKANASIKYPIFLLNSDKIIEGRINSTENCYYENTFNILNYIEDEELINEVDFEFTIKIIPSTQNFPVKYKLIDVEKDEEIILNNELESSKIIIGTNKANYNYKLVIESDLENAIQDLDENLNVEILVKGEQRE